MGSSPDWAPLHSGFGQATYTCVPVTKQYNLVPFKRVISLAGKVIVDLVESNGGLPQGLWLKLCKLTAKKLYQLCAQRS